MESISKAKKCDVNNIFVVENIINDGKPDKKSYLIDHIPSEIAPKANEWITMESSKRSREPNNGIYINDTGVLKLVGDCNRAPNRGKW